MIRKIKKYSLIGSGFLSIGIGVLGIFLPLLPTTPFLLLAAYCFCKSSPKHYEMLIQHKHLGPYIIHFKEKKGIPLRGKIISVLLIWISIGFSIYKIHPLWVRIILSIIAIGTTAFILRQKTLKE